MIVCVCKAVSDRHIKAAVDDGASCMRDLTRELRVGTCCGKCLPEAKAALSACLAHRNPGAAIDHRSPPRIDPTGTFFGMPSAGECAA